MSLTRNIMTVGGATVVSRLLGLARELGVAAVLGAGALADAYFVAVQIPNLFRRLVAEGALNAAFTPAWLRLRGAQRDALTAETFGTVQAALLVLVGLALLGAPFVIRALATGFEDGGERFTLATALLRLALPYVVLAGLVAVASALLTAQGRVGGVVASVVAFNVVLLAALGIVAGLQVQRSAYGAAILAGSFAAAGLVQLIVIWAAMVRAGCAPARFAIVPGAETRRFLARAIPTLIAVGTPQLALIAGTLVASPEPAAVSWLNYTFRLYELPLGIVAALTSAALMPAIAASVTSVKDRQRADATSSAVAAAAQNDAFAVALGLALPAAAGLALLAQPIARVLFEHGAFTARDTAMVASSLAIIALGLPGHALEKVLGAVAFAHQESGLPVRAGVLGLTGAVTVAIVMFPEQGHTGVAAGIAGGGWVASLVLAFGLRKRRWLQVDRAGLRRLASIAVSSAAMAAAVWGLRLLLLPQAGMAATAGALACCVAAGLVVYLAALRAFGIKRPRDGPAARGSRGLMRYAGPTLRGDMQAGMAPGP